MILNNQDSISPKADSAAQWSEEKYQEIENQLTGYWTQDVWNPHNNPFVDTTKKNLGSCVRFNGCPEHIKVEIKYACYQKLSTQEWQCSTLHNQASKLNRIVDWLKIVATNNKSLVDKRLNDWLMSLRTYLLEQNKFCGHRKITGIKKNGQLKEYSMEDDCIYRFTQMYKVIQDAYDYRSEYEKEIWDLRKLGIKVTGSNHTHLLDFTKISPAWLLKASQRFLKYKLSIVAPSTCHKKLYALGRFSDFICLRYPEIKPREINRITVVEYLSYLTSLELQADTRHQIIADLRDFIEMCFREGWADVTGESLIYDDDLPKYSRRRKADYIPDQVLEHIKQNLQDIKEPVHRRMFLILIECGMRISELCNIPFGCVKQDRDNLLLQYYQFKMKKEITIPIQEQVFEVIQEQQRYVKDKWGDNCYLLFSSPLCKDKPMSARPFCNSINQLTLEKDICDINGNRWHFHPHQCRHTVGTSMINNGVPQHIVQRFLGHESPTMTQVYAHIHDETLRRELEKYHEARVVDIAGQIVELERSSVGDDEDLEWFKKTVLAMALPHGWCGRPKVLGHCNLPPNSCLNCAHLRTNKNFLEVFKDELKRTNEILAKAKKYGWEVQVKMNEPIKVNLERMIAALETDD